MRQEPLSTWDEDVHALDLSAFPRAPDFVVEATDVQVGDGADRASWTNLRYVVPSWDIDVCFPWWDRSTRQMRGWTPADAPCGSIESPYWDRDQGWSLLLWQTGDEVFILEGDGSEGYDDPPVYQRWFAVPVSSYRSAWETAIEGFRNPPA
ncbi:MAG TPA: hypothetical protein VES42_26160 [Pilimelia sp.]|nr:hypothetical protein [Pilimelia sp.]